MLVQLLVALAVLVYSALQTDLSRKCKNAVPKSQSNAIQFVNVALLILSSLSVLYIGWKKLAPDSMRGYDSLSF